MNKLYAALLGAAVIAGAAPAAEAATVVTTHWVAPARVTTVHVTGPYWGIHPAPCCYGGGAIAAGVVTGLAVGATVAAASPPHTVVYSAAPPVTVYTAPPVVYTPAPYYYYVP